MTDFLQNYPRVNATRPHWRWLNLASRQWLDTVRQKAIIWNNADKYRRHQLVSLGHNKMDNEDLPVDMKKGTLYFPLSIRSRKLCNVLPSKGSAPHTNTYSTTPRLWNKRNRMNSLAPGRLKWNFKYRQISNIRGTKFQNLNVNRVILQLSLCNILKPDVKSRMKM